MGARRVIGCCVVGALVAAACGNASKAAKTGPSGTTNVASATTVGPQELHTHVPVSAPGVTDTEIRVAVITSKTNPMNGHYDALADGIQAYFDMVNSQGGIYGRQLKIVAQRDDVIGLRNQPETQASLAEDNAFATFEATLQLLGVNYLDQAGQPTFIWNINPEMAGHQNVFGQLGALCFTCPGPNVPWLARQAGAKNVGVLAYGVNRSSQDCGRGAKANFQKFGFKVAFYDESLSFAQPDLSAQVAQMKANDVQFVATCMDVLEVVTLAKEMQKQGLNVPQVLPFGYDQEYLRTNASVLEGYYIAPVYLAGEYAQGLKEHEDFGTWIRKSGKPVHEVTEDGWLLAHELVDGLKGAGPQFSQQKVIGYLNSQRSYGLGGMLNPIDWTKQHNDPTTHPQDKGKYDCFNLVQVKNGKFTVPSFVDPAKPWNCWDTKNEGPDSLDKVTKLSFAPSAT